MSNTTTSYLARPAIARPRLSQAKNGGYYLEVPFVLLEGPRGGQIVRLYASITGGAERVTENNLRAAGWRGDRIDLVALDTEASVEVLLENDSFNGRDRERVRFVNALVRSDVLPADAAEKIGLNRRMAFAVDVAGRGGARDEAPPRDPDAPETTTSDDLPF